MLERKVNRTVISSTHQLSDHFNWLAQCSNIPTSLLFKVCHEVAAPVTKAVMLRAEQHVCACRPVGTRRTKFKRRHWIDYCQRPYSELLEQLWLCYYFNNSSRFYWTEHSCRSSWCESDIFFWQEFADVSMTVPCPCISLSQIECKIRINIEE